MALSKLAIPSIFLALIFSQIWAEIPIPEWGRAVPSPGKNEPDSICCISPFQCENQVSTESEITKINELIKEKEKEKVIQQKSARISSMELQLKKNNELIKEEEKVIQQNSDRISSLRSEIESLQKNGSLVEQQVRNAHARADELEKKVNEHKKELQLQLKEKEDLKARLNEAKVSELEKELQSQRNEIEDLKAQVNEVEVEINELRLKVENVNELEMELQSQRNEKEELKDRVNEAEVEINELHLKVENVEMWEAKFEATLKEKVLNEVKELKKELQSQHNEKEDLKARVNEAEKKVDDLLSKIKNVQGTVKDLQKTRPLATKEMEWFAASALLALLIIILFRNFSTFLYKH